MRLFLVPLFVLGCTSFTSALKDVKPLPDERYVEPQTKVEFSPPVKPAPDSLWVCGYIDTTLRCIRYELFMETIKGPLSEDTTL